jgi:hypothetical protein
MRRKATIVKGGTKQHVGLCALWPAPMSSSGSSLQHAQKKRTAPQIAHKVLKKMEKKHGGAPVSRAAQGSKSTVGSPEEAEGKRKGLQRGLYRVRAR